MRLWKASAVAAVCTVLIACGGGGGGGAKASSTPPPSASAPVVYYKVGGSVVGLRGTGLKLQLGIGEVLDIEADGAFTFPTPIGNRLNYQVGVISQPSQLAQICTASNATGVIDGADVTNIVIECVTASFPVRANISGLEGNGLRLQLQAMDDATVPAQTVEVSTAGEVEFPEPVPDSTSYQLSIAQQPMSPAQWCIVDDELPLQHGAQSSPISITCTSDSYQVGGTVFGLRGNGLVITNNGTDDLSITANGSFAFSAPLFDRTSYEVKVSGHPTNVRQKCFVTNARGSVSSADVTHVFINCNATQQLGSVGDDEAHAAALDAASNLYVAGRTNASLGDATNAGGWDGFLLKFGPDGDVLWWRQFGSTGDEAVTSMAVTASGEIYIAGATSGDLDGVNAGSDDFFVAKYNTTGDQVWIHQRGSSAADVAHGIDVALDGTVYLAGATDGELVANAAAGGSDLLIAKLGADGTVLWTQQLGSPESDVAYGLEVDTAGMVHVVGGTHGELDGNANPTGETGFIVRYDALGNKQSAALFCNFNCWFDDPSTWRQTRFNSITLDVNGDAYVGGWTSATESGAAQPENFGGRQTLTTKVNAAGGFSWVRRSDGDGQREINSVELGETDGELYAVETADHRPALDLIGLVSRTHLGTFTESFRSMVSTPFAATQLRAIAVDSLSNAYAVGFTQGSVDEHTHLGGADIVIVRYNAQGEKL